MPTYAIIGFILVFVIIAVFSFISTNKIKKNGIEAEAVVTGVEVRTTQTIHDDTGMTDVDTTEIFHVKYKTQDGEEMEAVLINPRMGLKEGDVINIKYLPEKPKKVLMIK